jgi:DNA polymerase III alpha subunit
VENSAAYGFNSAHAYCMAIDSVTIAYLKAYYPLEFYKVVLQRFTNKGEKNKVSLIKQEMIKRGFSLKEIKFGDDNRQFNIDKENNCIIQTMTSIKDMPKSTPDALYELSLKGVKNRAEIYQYLISDNRINSKAIEILFKLNYFSQFGPPKKLMAEFEIYKKYIDSKVISKTKLSEEEINIIKECSGKETDKQFRDIDNKKLISKMIKITPIEKTTIFDLIKWQIEFLGYTTLSDISVSPTTWIITDIESSSFSTQKFSLYNIHYGALKQYRVDKKWSKNHNASIGDIITCALQEKDKFRKSENGSFLKTGEKEIIIKCYKKEGL